MGKIRSYEFELTHTITHVKQIVVKAADEEEAAAKVQEIIDSGGEGAGQIVVTLPAGWETADETMSYEEC